MILNMGSRNADPKLGHDIAFRQFGGFFSVSINIVHFWHFCLFWPSTYSNMYIFNVIYPHFLVFF